MLVRSIGPGSPFQKALSNAISKEGAMLSKTERAEKVEKDLLLTTSLSIAHVNSNYEWFSLVSEHFRPLGHTEEWSIVAECSTKLVDDEHAPRPPLPPKPPKETTGGTTSGSTKTTIEGSGRVSNRLKDGPGKAKGVTGSVAAGKVAGKKRKAGPGSSTRGRKKTKSDPSSHEEEEEDLSLLIRETEANLTITQNETLLEMMNALDRSDETRLWSTDYGKNRCFLRLANLILTRDEIIHDVEGIAAEDEDD